MMWWNNGMGWGGWLAMGLMMVAFWGLVVFAIVALVRTGGRSSDRPTRSSYERDPLEILDERFARGEIDVDEYHARKSVLRATTP